MESFNVLTLGEFIAGEESNIAILAFAEFYLGITTKHQKKSKLIVIDDRKFLEEKKELIKRYGISNAVHLVDLSEQDLIESYYKEASVFLLPSFQKVGNVMVEALSFKLPILSYDHPNHDEYVDHTCGMKVNHMSKEQSIQEFGSMLHMLYFDPEARKIFQKGASNKYQAQFTWGTPQRV